MLYIPSHFISNQDYIYHHVANIPTSQSGLSVPNRTVPYISLLLLLLLLRNYLGNHGVIPSNNVGRRGLGSRQIDGASDSPQPHHGGSGGVHF